MPNREKIKKGTSEVFSYIDCKKIKEIASLKDGILYFRSRILDEQTLKAVGNLEDVIDIKSFTGFNFRVPMIYRYSPLAILIGNHLHYEVYPHKGMETLYRLSLNHVHILQGRAIFRQISEDCGKCKIIRKKYLEVQMGPLNEAQVTISPTFFFTMIDLCDPFPCYPGPHITRATRSGDKSYSIYFMVLVCIATGTINIQVIEVL